VALGVQEPGVAPAPTRPVPALAVGLLAQFAVLVALAAGVGLGALGWLAATGYALATWALLGRAVSKPEAHRWGPADTVTLSRATLVGGVTALVVESLTAPVPVAVVVALASVALVLDAVDGHVARRTRTSALGARFDMEIDSVLVLVLSVFVAGSLGWWVVAIGGFRYAFGVAGWALPWLRAPLPVLLSRKAVAAMQGIALVVASAGLLPRPLALGLVGLSLALLCWSFGRDIAWLWRRRHQDAGQDVGQHARQQARHEARQVEVSPQEATIG